MPSYFVAIADSIEPGHISNHSSVFKDLFKPFSFCLDYLKGSKPQSVVKASQAALKQAGRAQTAVTSLHPSFLPRKI